MPKRNGAKKGHDCSEEFDRWCDKCWDTRLQNSGLEGNNALLDPKRRAHNTVRYEDLDVLPNGIRKDSHPGRCNCKVCRGNRKEETRRLRVISGDPEATAALGTWTLNVPVSLISAEELDRLSSASVLTFAFREKKRHKPAPVKGIEDPKRYVPDVDSETENAEYG